MKSPIVSIEVLSHSHYILQRKKTPIQEEEKGLLYKEKQRWQVLAKGN